jgi:purine-nucleoside phosphorylase
MGAMMKLCSAEEDRVETLARALRERLGPPPQITVVLGSGWRECAAGLLVMPVAADLATLPDWPVPRVAGHGVKILAGLLDGRRVALCGGRVHSYEGYSAAEIVRGVRATVAWGARNVLLLNAAGSLDPARPPGSLMPFADHLNLGLPDPTAAGASPDGAVKFQDLVDLYDPAWRERLVLRVPRARPGVYAGLPGPSYETPAEIRALRTLGADAVGMSTIPEAIAARAAGARVLAISLLTNFAAGVAGGRPNHEEVLATASAQADWIAEALRAAILEAPAELS